MLRNALLDESSRVLRDRGIANGACEARWMMEHVAGRGPGEMAVPAEQESRFRRLLARRLAGEPLQYVMGSAEFRRLELAVGPGVLIPRPETERLVDFALERYAGEGGVCDLCTGSGAVILALADELGEQTPMVGIDLSPEALLYARRNREAHGLYWVGLIEGDLFEPIQSDIRFGMVTANPPYVSPAEFAELPAEVAEWEPRLALYADERGLALVRRIAEAVPGRLAPGGWLLCEIGAEQGEDVAEICREAGFDEVEILQDYCQRDRVVAARLAP